MNCPNCGQELPERTGICPGCGQTLPEAVQDGAVREPEAAEETAAVDSENIQPEAAPAPETAADEPDAEMSAPAKNREPADGDAAVGEEPEAASRDGEEPEAAGGEAVDGGTSEAAGGEAVDGEETGSAGEAPRAKKRSPLAIIVTAVIAVLLVAVVCLTITVTTLSRTGDMPGFLASIVEFFERRSAKSDAIALEINNEAGETLAEITNAKLSYYFWGEFYYYIQSSGYTFDANEPLETQPFDGEQTVQEYFLNNAATSMIQTEALKAEAEQAGFTMPQEYQEEYDDTVESMADYALQTGFADKDGKGDVLAYIQDSYGIGATEESFRQYLYDSYYVSAYSDSLYQDIEISDEEIETYYDENSDMFQSYGVEKSDLPNVNVRHILVSPESGEDGTISDEAWEEAEEEAEELLKTWKSGDATEESFGALANTDSDDPGASNNGGLYENVYPGQMVTEFNDWCFTEGRKPGDTEIVKTSYGYHIIYFVSATEEYYWKTTVRSEMQYHRYQEQLSAITGQYTTETTKDLKLVTPDAAESARKQAAQQQTQAAAEQDAADETAVGSAAE